MPLTMMWLRPRLGKSRGPEKKHGMLDDRHRFDEQTGQVYTEKTAAATNDLDRDWVFDVRTGMDVSYYDATDASARRPNNQVRDMIRVFKQRGDLQDEQRRASKVISKTYQITGARSLVDVALDMILQKLDDLTMELLSDLPVVLLQRIWEETKKREMISFHVWRIFSALLAGHDASLRLLRYRDRLSKPQSLLRFYTDPLTSKSFDFLTYLSITTAFAVPELVRLSAIKNLVALEIVSEDGKSEYGVSDRIIRAWSIAAADENAFSVLRLLKLLKHPFVTKASIAYISTFPALAVYEVTGCGFDLNESIKAGDFGWVPTVHPNPLRLFEAACVERAVFMREELDKEPRPVTNTSAKQLSDNALVSRLPRAEIPEFLARDEITCRQVLKDPLTPSLLKIEPNMQTKKQRRRGIVFGNCEESFPSLPIETWDFSVYTTICKVGELRNDGDLKGAGINIGDQPIVDSDLICPIPIVSFRIGPTPKFLLPTNQDAPLGGYKSTNSISASLHQALQTLKKAPPRNDSSQVQRLAFTRIKYDLAEIIPRSVNQGLHSIGNTHGPLKRPSTAGSRPTTSGEAAPAKRRSMGPGLERKKKNLGDVLGSFMS